MRITEASYARLWALGLAVLSALAAILIVQVNPLEMALVYLVILAAVIAVGLMANGWGGLLAGALGVFAVMLISRYTGIYPRENLLLSVASEMIALLLIGPLAGGLSGAVERAQRETNRWLARAEELSVHDDVLGTLKPAWARLRLEEEAARSAHFGRPLTVVLLLLAPRPGTGSRAERLAALQAVLRVVRAATPPAAVVAHTGEDQVLVILPEHTLEGGYRFVEQVRQQATATHYFPPRAPGPLGKPLGQYGDLHTGLAALNGVPETADELLARARAGLEENPCLN